MKSTRLLAFFGLILLAVFAAVSLVCALPDAVTSAEASNFPVLPVSVIVAAEAFLVVAIKITIGKRNP